MKLNEYWWIKNKKTGKLLNVGRKRDIFDDKISESGSPNINYYRCVIKKYCKIGEIPVRVRLVEVRKK